MFKSQQLPPFNPVATSCIVKQTVLLNIDKDGRMFCGGFWKKSVSYNTYNSDSSSWILNRLASSCFGKCWYLWWRKRNGKRVLFIKPWVEAAKQMTQNWTFRSLRISKRAKIASRRHVWSIYFMFPFWFTVRLKTYVEGTYMLNLLLPRFIDKKWKVALKIFDRDVSSASFQRIYTGYWQENT